MKPTAKAASTVVSTLEVMGTRSQVVALEIAREAGRGAGLDPPGSVEPVASPDPPAAATRARAGRASVSIAKEQAPSPPASPSSGTR